jgi:hypothetical protein
MARSSLRRAESRTGDTLTPARLLLVGAAVLMLPAGVQAHRLDEVLQTTRISIGVNQIDLDVAISPGIETAAAVLSAVDVNRNGAIDAIERRSYVDGIARALRLSVDGRVLPLRPARYGFPASDAVRGGVGVIQLALRADFESGSGRHNLSFANGFAPAGSVYQVNALTPVEPGIDLRQPVRDARQRTFVIDYDVTRSHVWRSINLAMGAIVALVIARRYSFRSRRNDAHVRTFQ